MNEITHFYGILSTRGLLPSSHLCRSPAKAGPDGLILTALHPLQDELDVALARGNREGALQIAYGALGQVADALAAYRGDSIRSGQVRVHALLVEMETLPLESRPDGTLTERGTAVHVSYCHWVVDQAQAAMMAHALVTHLQTLWPGAR